MSPECLIQNKFDEPIDFISLFCVRALNKLHTFAGGACDKLLAERIMSKPSKSYKYLYAFIV